MTVGILGMTFKADSDDPRDSLSFKLRKSLAVEAKEVLCTDPFLDADFLTPLEETIERSALLFVGAPHTVYRTTDFRGKPVIDIWNATKNGIRVL
jgi:UDP-N-acetyl-D-mannosaminuronic acid dehydrogenase